MIKIRNILRFLNKTTYKAEGFIMAYKYSIGQGEQGDIVYSSDLDLDTKIDFEEDVIKLVTNGTEYVTVSTGSININLGTDIEYQSSSPFGRRYFTDLRFEKVENFNISLDNYINKLKLEN